VYIAVLLLITTACILLPYIQIDITIKTPGITRPQNERTEVKPAMPGIIDTIFYKEGERVDKGEVILRLKDLTSKVKRNHNLFEITQRSQFIHDLRLLTKGEPGEKMMGQLQSALYTEQLNRFLREKSEQAILLKKANKELEMNTPLAKDKVISPKEFFDIQNNQEKLIAAEKSFTRSQLSTWLQELSRYRLELSQFYEQMNDVNVNAAYHYIKAPVSGIVQGIHGRYPGGYIEVNEPICTISPEGKLVGECLLQTKDIGLLRPGQQVRYQVDAFDYNYFGVLTGKVISIDNDFTNVDNKPVFKVHCSFDSTQLHLKNGFTAQIKKGLAFQASFTVIRRSLWQLLFDKLDDWLNPNAPSYS
jgi:HlyD family secretion protein